MSERFQFRLRHLLLVVTILCVFLATWMFAPFLAMFITVVLVVGSGMARISTRSRRLWIVGPVFAFQGCLIFGLLGSILAASYPNYTAILLFAYSLPVIGVLFGGWYGGRLERRHSSM